MTILNPDVVIYNLHLSVDDTLTFENLLVYEDRKSQQLAELNNNEEKSLDQRLYYENSDTLILFKDIHSPLEMIISGMKFSNGCTYKKMLLYLKMCFETKWTGEFPILILRTMGKSDSDIRFLRELYQKDKLYVNDIFENLFVTGFKRNYNGYWYINYEYR